jgi:hypothetical protein
VWAVAGVPVGTLTQNAGALHADGFGDFEYGVDLTSGAGASPPSTFTFSSDIGSDGLSSPNRTYVRNNTRCDRSRNGLFVCPALPLVTGFKGEMIAIAVLYPFGDVHFSNRPFGVKHRLGLRHARAAEFPVHRAFTKIAKT